MSNEKKNVQLTDLAEKQPDDVKGGALSINSSYASVNLTSPTLREYTTANISPQLDLSKVASTVMCPW